MEKKESSSSLFLVISMFIITLATMILLIFRNVLDSVIVDALIIILPAVLVFIIYMRYRKNHLRHIYSNNKN